MNTEFFMANQAMALIALPLTLLATYLVSDKGKAKVLLLGQLSASVLATVGAFTKLFLPQLPDYVGEGFFSLHFNLVSSFLLAGVLFIASAVIVFSERYLSGESNRLNFMRCLSLMSSAAALMTVTDSLVTGLVCWHALSLGLWGVMRMQPQSSGKSDTVILFHLFSDLLLLCATFMLIAFASCTRFSELAMDAHSLSGLMGTVICSLLVLAFGIKSALFPFHKWLLSTLDAPTPLSGFLHAGVVNVSAVMALNFSSLLNGQSSILFLWSCWAVLSAIIGTLSMSAQPDVKRKLVYSTVGQMGFMSLQCASGAYGAAIFHLLAHGMFKCHMFLQSGTAVAEGVAKRKFGYFSNSSKANFLFVSSLAFAYCLILVLLQDFNWTLMSALIAAAAFSFTVPTLSRVKFRTLSGAWLLCLGLVSIAGILCHRVDALAIGNQGNNSLYLPAALIGFALCSLVLEMLRGSRFSKWLYVQSLNGFYAEDMGSSLVRSFKTQ